MANGRMRFTVSPYRCSESINLFAATLHRVIVAQLSMHALQRS